MKCCLKSRVVAHRNSNFRACSHARTRSLMCAVLLLAHARCVLARAFSCCRSRAFWEAQLSNGSKRARGHRPLMRAAFTCFSHIRSLLPLSDTLALSVALDCLCALRSRLFTHAALSLTHAALSLTHARCALARCALARSSVLRYTICYSLLPLIPSQCHSECLRYLPSLSIEHHSLASV